MPSGFFLLFLFFWLQDAASWQEALSAVGQMMAGEKDSTGAVAFKLESSGVIVDSQGIVATNYHVIRDRDKTFPEIYINLIDPQNPYRPPERSRLYKLEVVAIDAASDLALLKIIADADGRPLPRNLTFRAIPLGSSEKLSFLDEIYAAGFPKAGGATLTVTQGQISGKEEREGWLKIDAQVTHGSSGGAAINRRGELLGIPTKVRPDVQEVDTDGDGFPDKTVSFGTVALIRPVESVRTLLDQWRQGRFSTEPIPDDLLTIRGLVQNRSGNSVAGALVGLLKPGSTQASVENLLTWSRADENGIFQFPAPVAPGLYTIRVRAEGYEIFLQSFSLNQKNFRPIVRLQALPSSEAEPVPPKP